MKRFTAFLMLLSCSVLMAAPAFLLSKDRPLSIAISESPTPAEKTAAEELHEYLQKREVESDAFMARSPMATRIVIPNVGGIGLPPSLPYLDRDFFTNANVILAQRPFQEQSKTTL